MVSPNRAEMLIGEARLCPCLPESWAFWLRLDSFVFVDRFELFLGSCSFVLLLRHQTVSPTVPMQQLRSFGNSVIAARG